VRPGAPILLLAALAVGGCEDKTDTQRCEQIEQILVARGEQLPTDCESDSDCRVVEVRPGIAAVSNQPFDDSTVADLRGEYERQCGTFDVTYRSAITICEDFGTTRSCTIFVRSVIITGDEALDSGRQEEVLCDCTTEDDCPLRTPICDDCVCRDDCGVACAQVSDCDMLQNLGFGGSIGDCTVRCQSLYENDPIAGASRAACLSSAVCTDLAACGPQP
jgi:hypothetical protein